jgi:hypothetical protein
MSKSVTKGRKSFDKFSLLLVATMILVPFVAVFLIHRAIPSLGEISEILSTSTNVSNLFYAPLWGVILFANGVFYIVFLILSSSLLFDVTFMRKKLLKSGTFWRTYLGYFMLIALLLSMFASELLDKFVYNLWGTAGGPTLVFTAIVLGFTILGARVMSKLPIKVEDTNLGSFVIVIYISYAVFKVLSQSFSPLNIWINVLNVGLVESYANAFYLLSLPAILSLIFSFLDKVIMRKIVNSTRNGNET